MNLYAISKAVSVAWMVKEMESKAIYVVPKARCAAEMVLEVAAQSVDSQDLF